MRPSNGWVSFTLILLFLFLLTGVGCKRLLATHPPPAKRLKNVQHLLEESEKREGELQNNSSASKGEAASKEGNSHLP